MKRRVLTAVAGVALLAASVALALLGRAVLATPTAVDRAAPGLPARAQVDARHRSLADRAAASLLGADRDDAFIAIVGIYHDAMSLPAAAGDPKGPVRISRLIPKLRSPGERAQALTIAGTLLAYSAGAGFGAILPSRAQAPTAIVLGQARENFRGAVRSDSGNEAAKYDLELLLRQQQAQSPQRPQTRKRKQTPKTQDNRKKRAPGNGVEQHAGIYETGTGY